MFETAYTLSLSQFARSLSFPERIQKRPGRNGVLEAWRARNTGIDSLFYDVGTLTTEEVYYISDAIAAEGLIMIVPPRGGPMLTLCETVDEFFARGGKQVSVLAVAGMGGSAVGAAAFARNVADAVGSPVAAVVSGYGLGDIVSESMGASFLFGWLGRFRSQCEMIDDVIGRPHFGAYGDRASGADTSGNHACLDVETVEALLADTRLNLSLLVAHSRGSLVLSEALSELRDSDGSRLAEIAAATRIVTFGARMTMPAEFRDVTDVMGGYDWYGEMNSHPAQGGELRVPMTGHSTNTNFPGSLKVTALLQSILAQQSAEPVAVEADTVDATTNSAEPEETPPDVSADANVLPFAPVADATAAPEVQQHATKAAMDLADTTVDIAEEAVESGIEATAEALSGTPARKASPASDEAPLPDAAATDGPVSEADLPAPEMPASAKTSTAASSGSPPASSGANGPALARNAGVAATRGHTEKARTEEKTADLSLGNEAATEAPKVEPASAAPVSKVGPAKAASKSKSAKPAAAAKSASTKSTSKTRRPASAAAARRSRRTGRH